jgi:23S rRNA-intervening sequence protein
MTGRICRNVFVDFGAMIVGLVLKFAKNPVERHIGLQLLGSATSFGANYQEACAAESRADFVHKMQIVLKNSVSRFTGSSSSRNPSPTSWIYNAN